MNPLDPEQLILLLRRLISQTKRGLLRWEVAQSYEYVAQLPRHTVHIASVDRDDAPPYLLTLYRQADDLELVGSVETDVVPDTFEANEINGGLKELYLVALRSARNIDLAMREILEDLDELEEEPF